MFNLFKKKSGSYNKPSPIKKYDTFVIDLACDDNAIKYYRKNKKDDLYENDDYSLPKKELFDMVYSSDKIFKYEPTDFPCRIEGSIVYDEDGRLIGEIDSKDMHLLQGDYKANILFNEGSYKYVDALNEEIETVKGFAWFDLEIKKEAH